MGDRGNDPSKERPENDFDVLKNPAQRVRSHIPHCPHPNCLRKEEFDAWLFGEMCKGAVSKTSSPRASVPDVVAISLKCCNTPIPRLIMVQAISLAG